MNYDRQITISVGASRKSINWQPLSLTLTELYQRLRNPPESTETLSEYLKLSKGQQDELKDSLGGFVGGTLSGVRRKSDAVTGRDLLTLDLDNIPAGMTQEIIQRVIKLQCNYCIYSTRKHQSAKPRLRVLLPLDRTVSADEYEPIGRKIAEMIGIDLADPTTFEAHRLMYWPTLCKGGEYVYEVGDYPLLSADAVLAMYADWHDYSQWPSIPGEMTPARLAAKQGDPLTKEGVVGAFCRTYSIEDAMDAYLPGIYEAVENSEGRYTFLGGSTTGGAVLYDDGKFLYSHHATDPCSGKLVNAFDLVRLHRFGEMDDAAAVGTPASRLPSYKAMCESAGQDEKVSKLLLTERWSKAGDAFTAVSTPTIAGAEDDNSEWLGLLKRDAQGGVLKVMSNLVIALKHDPTLAGKVRFNEFSNRIDVAGELPWLRAGEFNSFTDTDVSQLRIYLEPLFGKTNKNDVFDAVDTAANDQSYHPVRDYLNGLTWDGTERLDTVFIDYLGAEDSEYTRAVTRKSLVAAVTRVMIPGCKYDTMPVLVGGQGRHKSTILAKLGGKWFSDSLRTFGDKDSMETIQGTWINEVAEMQAMAKTEVEGVKMFLTKTSDYFRAAYGRLATEKKRQCVFFGTTNTHECLTDLTGNRRFWPIDIDKQERTKNVFADLDRERDQIWAEAVLRFRLGEPLHLTGGVNDRAVEVQEDHREQSPLEGIIAEYLESEVPENWERMSTSERQAYRAGGLKYEGERKKLDRICALEIWCEALGKSKGDIKRTNNLEISKILARQPGWVRASTIRAGEPYGIQRGFLREK